MLRVGWGSGLFEGKILISSTKCLSFSARGGPFVAKPPFIDLAKVDFPAAARRRAGGPEGVAEIAWVDDQVLEIRRNGPDESSANEEVSKVWNKLALATVLSTVSLNVAFADCCTTDLNAADRGQPAYPQANTCAYFLGQLPNQWIVRGRGSTGPGLRWQPCRAADRSRQSGPVKGPPHHCRWSERFAGGTHPPAATAYDRRTMDTATTGGRCRHQ